MPHQCRYLRANGQPVNDAQATAVILIALRDAGLKVTVTRLGDTGRVRIDAEDPKAGEHYTAEADIRYVAAIELAERVGLDLPALLERLGWVEATGFQRFDLAVRRTLTERLDLIVTFACLILIIVIVVALVRPGCSQ